MKKYLRYLHGLAGCPSAQDCWHWSQEARWAELRWSPVSRLGSHTSPGGAGQVKLGEGDTSPASSVAEVSTRGKYLDTGEKYLQVGKEEVITVMAMVDTCLTLEI